MDFHCQCTDTDCYCIEEVFLSVEEQNDIILARIMGEVMDYDIQSSKICGQCSEGWHLYDPDSEERTKKEETDETNQGSQGSAKSEVGAESS